MKKDTLQLIGVFILFFFALIGESLIDAIIEAIFK